jgi:hypothetical protein
MTNIKKVEGYFFPKKFLFVRGAKTPAISPENISIIISIVFILNYLKDSNFLNTPVKTDVAHIHNFKTNIKFFSKELYFNLA